MMRDMYKEMIQKHLDNAYGVCLSLWEGENRVQDKDAFKKVIEKITQAKVMLSGQKEKKEEEEKDATKRRLHEQISTLAIKHEKLVESVKVLEQKAEGKWSYGLKLSERVRDLEEGYINSDRIKIKKMLVDASNKIEACLGWTHSMGDNEDLKETNQKLIDSVYDINKKMVEVIEKRRKDG